jgi:uncharacterized membrane protein HdeD (DUF308 family)
MTDDRSPRWSVRLVVILALAIAAWFLLWPVLSLIRSLIALALYVVVAFVAYQIGKFVGRADRAADERS